MPDRVEILAGLTRLANDGYWFAVAWHCAVAVAVGVVIAGWRPSRRLAGAVVAAPLASVSACAWLVGNPFNGVVFAALAVALAIVSLARRAREPIELAPLWAQIAGATMVLFGWVYPHFLVGRSLLHYLVAAPVGLIPCPTLAVVIGAAIATRGFGSRAYAFTLAGVGLFYAVFGVARLGVWLDLGLLAGAVALAVVALPSIRVYRKGISAAA